MAWKYSQLLAVALAIPLTLQVTRVVDGDTYDAADGHRYRPVGFDTPETFRPKCAAEAALGKRATARAKELLGNAGQIIAWREKDKWTRDRNGRRLAMITVDGIDIGVILMREGLARPYHVGAKNNWCAFPS